MLDFLCQRWSCVLSCCVVLWDKSVHLEFLRVLAVSSLTFLLTLHLHSPVSPFCCLTLLLCYLFPGTFHPNYLPLTLPVHPPCPSTWDWESSRINPFFFLSFHIFSTLVVFPSSLPIRCCLCFLFIFLHINMMATILSFPPHPIHDYDSLPLIHPAFFLPARVHFPSRFLYLSLVHYYYCCCRSCWLCSLALLTSPPLLSS